MLPSARNILQRMAEGFFRGIPLRRGEAPSDWKEKWKKLRDRFEKIIDAGCKMECFLIQRRIPQSKAGHREYPGVLHGLKTFQTCNGLWIKPSRLISPSWEPLIGLFPFNN